MTSSQDPSMLGTVVRPVNQEPRKLRRRAEVRAGLGDLPRLSQCKNRMKRTRDVCR